MNKIYIDCVYYGFFIDVSDLNKFNNINDNFANNQVYSSYEAKIIKKLYNNNNTHINKTVNYEIVNNENSYQITNDIKLQIETLSKLQTFYKNSNDSEYNNSNSNSYNSCSIKYLKYILELLLIYKKNQLSLF